MLTTTLERKAVLAAVSDRQGPAAADAFKRATGDVKDARVFTLEESAATYLAMGGNPADDPILKDVIDAAKQAGRISTSGEYVGPSTDSDGEDDDEGTPAGASPISDEGPDEFIDALEQAVHATAAKDPKTASNSCC